MKRINIHLEVVNNQELPLHLEIINNQELNLSLKSNVIINQVTDTSVYDGRYEVTPITVEQRLETANQFLEEDIIIKPIPFYKMGNEAGGDTIYIGSEVI